MPIVILAIIGIVYLIAHISENVGVSKTVLTHEQLMQCNKEMIGKSQKECRKILKKYYH